MLYIQYRKFIIQFFFQGAVLGHPWKEGAVHLEVAKRAVLCPKGGCSFASCYPSSKSQWPPSPGWELGMFSGGALWKHSDSASSRRALWMTTGRPLPWLSVPPWSSQGKVSALLGVIYTPLLMIIGEYPCIIDSMPRQLATGLLRRFKGLCISTHKESGSRFLCCCRYEHNYYQYL